MNNTILTNELIKPNSEYRQINNFSQLTNEGYELVIYLNNNKYYLLDGQYHRENAPAIIFMDGFQEWYIHGKRHTRAVRSLEDWVAQQ